MKSGVKRCNNLGKIIFTTRFQVPREIRAEPSELLANRRARSQRPRQELQARTEGNNNPPKKYFYCWELRAEEAKGAENFFKFFTRAELRAKDR